MNGTLVGVGAAIIATAGAISLGTRLVSPDDPFAPCRDADRAVMQSISEQFTLVSETGETVTDAEVFTRPTLIYFGYTFCPDVCPLDNIRNADAVDLVRARGIDAQAVFATIDPDRDTREVVAAYTENFSEEMLGLTGSAQQVADAAKSFGVIYKKRDGEDPEYYMMDHSTLTYLVLPGSGAVDIVKRETPPDAVAKKLACFGELELIM